MKKLVLGSVLALMVSAATASAAPFAPTIDFRSPSWNPGPFSNSWSNDGVIVDAEPDFGALSWSSDHGFGVNTWLDREGDEINNIESLRVGFDMPTTVSGFLITHLFGEGSRNPYDEIGYYSLDSGNSWEQFSRDPNRMDGLLWVSIAPTLVDEIWFAAPLLSLKHDFAVGGIDVDPAAVPEPTSMVLLGTGLIGLASRIRRKRNS